MRILLVEDEEDIARPLLALLSQERHQVAWANSLNSAYAHIAEAEPDLLILDVMLPEGVDAGFTLAQQLRDVDFMGPILFLTARDTIEDRVQGLDLGGDDYLAKPFDLLELRARVRALLRRQGQVRSNYLERDRLRVDFTARSVYWNNLEVTLTEREFALLELLALSPERVYKVDELLDRLFPTAESGHHILRMYVSKLRDKIAPEVIRTVPGGYRLGLS